MTSEQYGLRADMLWILKALGAILSCTYWPLLGLLIVLWPVADYHSMIPFWAWLGMIAGFVLWYFGYFRLLCPWQRYYRECQIALRTGRPAPSEPTPLSGTPLQRLYEAVDRTIGQVHMPGYAIHPSEDGNNDLGQTGPLSRHTANQFGYANKVRIVPVQDGSHCAHCGSRSTGVRQCGTCGTYLHSDGSIDHEAEAFYQARASS